MGVPEFPGTKRGLSFWDRQTGPSGFAHPGEDERSKRNGVR
jgi:hypothetical protein